MAREYRYLQMYEKEILELREEGLTQREISVRFGVSLKRCTISSNGITVNNGSMPQE